MKYILSVRKIDADQILGLISSFLIGENRKLIDWMVEDVKQKGCWNHLPVL